MTPDVEAALLQKVGEIHADVVWLKENAADVKPRLAKLEKRSWFMTGAGLVLAAICTKMGFPNLMSAFYPWI